LWTPSRSALHLEHGLDARLFLVSPLTYSRQAWDQDCARAEVYIRQKESNVRIDVHGRWRFPSPHVDLQGEGDRSDCQEGVPTTRPHVHLCLQRLRGWTCGGRSGILRRVLCLFTDSGAAHLALHQPPWIIRIGARAAPPELRRIQVHGDR